MTDLSPEHYVVVRPVQSTNRIFTRGEVIAGSSWRNAAVLARTRYLASISPHDFTNAIECPKCNAMFLNPGFLNDHQNADHPRAKPGPKPKTELDSAAVNA